MKTKKQVIDAFVRLQKQYADVKGFVSVEAYTDGGSYWSVKLAVTAFHEKEIVWSEKVEWNHYTYHREADEARNEQKVVEFVKRMEGRING